MISMTVNVSARVATATDTMAANPNSDRRNGVYVPCIYRRSTYTGQILLSASL